MQLVGGSNRVEREPNSEVPLGDSDTFVLELRVGPHGLVGAEAEKGDRGGWGRR